MSSEMISRRELLKLGVVAGAGAVMPTFTVAAPESEQRLHPTLRIAHLNDSHTQPELRAAEGTMACLRHVRNLKPSVDMIVTGGDLVMDCVESDHARTKLQWDLYTKILRDECSIPVEHTLGNHDIWGWNKKKSGAAGTEPEYGKKWALNVLGLSMAYRSFDRGGWHFIVLDSVMSDGDGGYLGRLDDEQFDWLRHDLSALDAKTPVIVVSHIPILAACVLNDVDGKGDKSREFKVPGGLMMTDSRRIRELFRLHRNVRLCLSGHIHQLDRVDFDGVSYICDGAVCGAWWKGPNDHCVEGYGVVDLHPDGAWSHEYVAYGWKAETR